MSDHSSGKKPGAKVLRTKAEKLLKQRLDTVANITSLQEAQRLLHELQVHEIELELQNQELLRTQAALEESYQKYSNLYDEAPIGYLTTDFDGKIIEVNSTLASMLGVSLEALQNSIFTQFITSDDQDNYYFHRRQLAQTPGFTTCEVRLIHSNGTLLDVKLDSIFSPRNQSNYGIRTSVTDISIQKQLQHAAQRERAFSLALRKTATALALTLHLDTLLEIILDQIATLIHYDAADIMLVRDGVAYVSQHRGYEAPEIDHEVSLLQFPIAETPTLIHMQTTRHPLVIPDISKNKLWTKVLSSEWFKSFIGTAIVVDDVVLGFANLVAEKPDSFTGEDAEYLEAFAKQAGLAIRNAKLHQEAQNVAAIQERHRLARDMHDAVSQTLFSAAMLSEAVAQIGKTDPESVVEHLDPLHHLVRSALTETRVLLGELRPEAMTNVNLEAKLQQLLSTIKGHNANIETQLNYKVDMDLPVPVQTTCYRIAQEAINNIRKHAQAKKVTLSLVQKSDWIELNVVDDGRGFDDKAVANGFGFTSMRERADAIGADLKITSHQGEGTHILVVWIP